MLYIGLMSGTSMDGIDAALIQTDGEFNVETIAHYTKPYPDYFHHLLKLAERIAHALSGDIEKIRVAFTEQLEADVSATAFIELANTFGKYFHRPLTFDNLIFASTLYHIKAVRNVLNAARKTSKDVEAIGYHGQTLYHSPKKGITLQIGDADLLAKETGITTVYDFRSDDIRLGGEGAPLAPIYHRALAVRDKLTPVAIVNLGGIANLSMISDDNLDHLIGYDIGPANTLLDHYLKKQTHGKILFDENGQYSKTGKACSRLLKALKNHPKHKAFIEKSPPKSLDANDFELPDLVFNYSQKDACRTLVQFTAELIADNVKPYTAKQLLLTGGGSHNQTLLDALKNLLDIPVKKVNDLGWHSDTLEAELFAYLAARRLHNKVTNLPQLTGLSKAISAGQIKP